MHCNSKLSKVDEKNKFLEGKLLEHTQLIDELTIYFCKLELSPTKQKRKQFTFQDYIKINKGEVLFDFLSIL